MKTEHTPGPWKVVPIGSQLYVEFDGGFICDMQLDANPDDREASTIEANAQLIASAPALLAENKRLRSALDGILHIESRGVPEGALEACQILARAALQGGGL